MRMRKGRFVSNPGRNVWDLYIGKDNASNLRRFKSRKERLGQLPNGEWQPIRRCFKSRKERLGPEWTLWKRAGKDRFQIPEGTFGTLVEDVNRANAEAFQIPEGTFGTTP